jgi:hypothetical protein
MSVRWDFLKLALIFNVSFILLAVITAAILAWENAASRNLALATGALIAGAVPFLIQLQFELQGSKDLDHVSTEFTIDRTVPSIRQWNYTGTPSWRMVIETHASDWLVAKNAAAFNADREVLSSDFAVFSLLGFLTVQKFDWQLRKVTIRSQGLGTGFMSQPISRDKECRRFDESDLRAALTNGGNMFAGAPLTLSSGTLRLPPKSTIEIGRKSIVIRNPICRISWHLEDIPFVLSNMQPGSGGETPGLPSGEPRFETRMKGFRVEVIYFRLRSQSPDIGKYRDWVLRVLTDVHEWFESGESGESGAPAA